MRKSVTGKILVEFFQQCQLSKVTFTFLDFLPSIVKTDSSMQLSIKVMNCFADLQFAVLLSFHQMVNIEKLLESNLCFASSGFAQRATRRNSPSEAFCKAAPLTARFCG
jgi:hypothetical protein